MACSCKQTKAGFRRSVACFVIGLVTGLLYAPKSGKETRKEIAKRINDTQNSATKAFKKSQDKAAKNLDEVRDRVNKLNEKTGEAYKKEKKRKYKTS